MTSNHRVLSWIGEVGKQTDYRDLFTYEICHNRSSASALCLQRGAARTREGLMNGEMGGSN